MGRYVTRHVYRTLWDDLKMRANARAQPPWSHQRPPADYSAADPGIASSITPHSNLNY